MYAQTEATAVHCVASLILSPRLIMTTKMSMKTVRATDDQSMMPRRPPRSIVEGVKNVPIAKTLFITAESRCERNGDRPTCPKMMVL